MSHQELLTQCLEELQMKRAVLDGLLHFEQARWSVDQDAGQIVFTAPDGTVATCPVQIVGTFNTRDSTWLWGWDHPSVHAELSAHAQRVREYGEAHRIPALTTRKLSATAEQCWEFTALACKLNEAQGGYRAQSGTTLIFVTYGAPTLSQPGSAPDETLSPPSDPFTGEFTADIPPEVRTFVTSFITALYNWEVASHAATTANDSREASQAVRQSYAKLLQEWCASDVRPGDISYGSHPSHDPATEKLLSAATTATECRVRTAKTKWNGRISNYEYQLRREGARWVVKHLYYLEDDGKYERL